MYINQRNFVTLCFEPRPCWLGILEAQTFVAWALQLRCGVVGSDPDPWVPPGLQTPRVRSECLLWILEAFKALGSFLLPSHSHISFRGTEFTQLHFLLLFFGFLVLVSKVLSEDLHPVGAPSGWDRTERLSCLWKKPWKTFQTLMCNYSYQAPPAPWQLCALVLRKFIFQGNSGSQFLGEQEERDMVGSWWIWSLGQDCFFHGFQSPSVSGFTCWHWQLL